VVRDVTWRADVLARRTEMVDEWMRKRQLEIAVRALMREEAVVNHYAGRGYRVLTTTDRETRSLFGIPDGNPVADIVVELPGNRAIIAEVKGSDLDRALLQLESTARAPKFLGRRFVSVECKIFVTPDRPLPPAANTLDLRGGTAGLQAVRVFKRDYPGEWLLYRYRSDRTTEPVRISNSVVCIVFGPNL
jgi:hypothetical protein